MKYTTILLDLDGTLLGMDEDLFIKAYFKRLCMKLASHGYEPQKLIDVIWKGTKAMAANDGSKRNDEVFWQVFAGEYGEAALQDYPVFEDFYLHEFDEAKNACETIPEVKPMIESLLKHGYRLALATNPIFPRIATEKRIGWAGLKPGMFEIVTTYENFRHAKPNLDYYRDIIGQLCVTPQECLMVGNDVHEDGIARQLGIDVFLFPRFLINRKNIDISSYAQGGPAELLAYLEVDDALA